MSQQSIMKGANLVQVLASTLNPSTTHSSLQTLSQLKAANGFAVELLIISDDANYDISIRQSALIYLKNLLCEHCERAGLIPQADIHTLKGSLLEALIRNVRNGKLTPTFREIVFQMAQRYYPREWSEVVEQAVSLLEKSGELDVLLGTVQALKAIYSVFGASISKEIELNNLCNRSIIPILNLASRLFQSFSQQSSSILVGIFKLLSTSIQFFLPKIIELNIHSFMIFVKKILDLNADLASHGNYNLYLLKKICLRILFRLYQRHANFRITDNRPFAQLFHQKYTRPFVQTLVLQTLLRVDGDKTTRYRVLQLIKISLSCLAYINRENSQAATLLLQHRDGMVRLFMDKFRTPLTRSYQSFNDFKLYTQESRLHLKEFILSLIECEAIPEQQIGSANSILGLLLEYLEKGDNEQKDLALYLFTEISTQLKYLKQPLDQKMTAVLLNCVQPLLKQEQDLLIRARACQMIASYHYLDLPEDKIGDLALLIYSCLLVGTSEKEIFLKIYACNAFNSIMKYDNIVEFVRPYLPQILKIYTALLETDTSIIKNFEDLINLLEEEIAPFANDLANILLNMFSNYTSENPQTGQQGYTTLDREEKDQEEDEDEFDDDQDVNNEYNARACISSLRQVLQVPNANISELTQRQLLDIIVFVFSDPHQNYLEEGYNILNLLLYKLKDQVDPQYFLFFKVIVYAILGLPPNYIENLNRKGDGFSLKFAQILENICVEPDSDIIQNSIGSLRNFIAKSSGNFLRTQRDDLNVSLMDYILKLVPFVHENQSQKASQTDRLIILTIYITLIEYQAVNQQELREIVEKVAVWMQMEQEAIQEERVKNNNTGFVTFGKALTPLKYTYTPVYVQILLLAINFYDKSVGLNPASVVEKAITVADHFRCDYELSRVIVGFSHILNNKLVGDELTVKALLNSLPELVRRLCKLRQEGDSPQNDLQMDDQAEEEQIFGQDQNTHMLGWQGPKITDKDMQLKRDQDQQEDNDWEEQFNKFYESPLQKIDELKFLQAALTANAHIYGAYMSRESQDSLSLYLANAPPKA